MYDVYLPQLMRKMTFPHANLWSRTRRSAVKYCAKTFYVEKFFGKIQKKE